MTGSGAPDYLQRESGILLHPTSLPGPHGIGDLGAESCRFVDFLRAAGQRLWQVLPLGPVGYGNSPYDARSAMAGNPLLISLGVLAEEGLLSPDELAGDGRLPTGRVDYQAVEEFKMPLLREAHRRFVDRSDPAEQAEFHGFCHANASWLEDYALFMSLKETHDDTPWQDWEPDVISRREDTLERLRHQLAQAIGFRRFAQFQFFRQWAALKRHANRLGVRIMGDIPIFVSLDSADVWARQRLFHLDEKGMPMVVAGVPPDYFSKTGQRWGNPLYRWDVLAQERHEWWVERFRVAMSQVDLMRIDHFRGFESYWEIPADQDTAVRGQWVKGPGEDFFNVLASALGPLPVVAEDLGIITPEVEALRLSLRFPGMKVLHFAFAEGARNPYLPHNYERRFVAYTGTHDNDTTVGWFTSRPAKEQASVLRYLGSDDSEIHWKLIRLLSSSVADAIMVPLQDVLGLDSSARMNVPGQAEGNWEWRFTADQLRPEHAARMRELAITYGRYRPGN